MTLAEETKPDPEMTTVSPPANGPLGGATPVTVGADKMVKIALAAYPPPEAVTVLAPVVALDGTTTVTEKDSAELGVADPTTKLPKFMLTVLPGTNWEPETRNELPAGPEFGVRVIEGESNGTTKFAAAA
jgi:hypothetical protein